MTLLLEARSLVRYFGARRVVDEVSLCLEPGQVVGLLGPNGAGKTTTFRMIVGLLKPDRGEVLLDGAEVTRLPLHRRAAMGLGYLAQSGGLFPGLNVRENLMVAAEIVGLDQQAASRRADEMLERMQLTHIAGGREQTLSGGEKRRAEIARALMVQPRLLLFDEPFAGVDPMAVTSLQAEMRALADSGLAILITDHAVAATFSICDSLTILNEGRVLVSGSPTEVEADPRVRAAYLGPS